jgi:hypothetical protein
MVPTYVCKPSEKRPGAVEVRQAPPVRSSIPPAPEPMLTVKPEAVSLERWLALCA